MFIGDPKTFFPRETTQYCKMVESSSATNAATLLDHSKGSRSSYGGYYTADYEFTIPDYMTHDLTINDVIFQIDFKTTTYLMFSALKMPR